MTAASSPGRLEFQFGFGAKPKAAATADSAESFGFVIMADLSGRANRGVREPLASRRITAVDTDNFAKAFASLAVALDLPSRTATGDSVKLSFESLDDFHPDRLLQRVPPLAELLAARNLLQSPATTAQGAEGLQRLLGSVATTEPTAATPAARPESSEETLARLLGEAPASAPPPPGSRPVGLDVDALVKQIVGATSAAPAALAGASGLLSAADLELSNRLRALLHHRDFQALEAAWRGVDFLLRRWPDEERIKLFVLDATLAELAADTPGLSRLLRDQQWAGVIGNYTFGASRADLETLGSLAKLCASLGTWFLAGADSRLVGCDSFARHPDPEDWRFDLPGEVREAWQNLRAAPDAAHVGLALPRFLLRQPYGRSSEPIDSFPFEEIADSSAHEAFLWGNPAFLCAQLRVEACAAGEPVEDETPAGEVGDLPMFVCQEAGETAMKPCAEAWLGERAAAVILQHGLIPCRSVKGRNAVQLAGL